MIFLSEWNYGPEVCLSATRMFPKHCSPTNSKTKVRLKVCAEIFVVAEESSVRLIPTWQESFICIDSVCGCAASRSCTHTCPLASTGKAAQHVPFELTPDLVAQSPVCATTSDRRCPAPHILPRKSEHTYFGVCATHGGERDKDLSTDLSD